MTVFVCQRHMVRDRVTHQLTDKYNLADAKRFGRLVYCVEHAVDVMEPRPIIERLDNCLARYTEEDFLLMIGSPLIIGMACAIASNNSPTGVVNCLQWTPSERAYINLKFNLFATEKGAP